MFDVGFAELVLILVIGLLVLGPERLPGAIRTTGLWIARLRRSFNDIRTEIEREARIDDIKRDLHNQSILDNLKGTAEDLDKLRELPYDVSDVVTRHNRTTPTLPAADSGEEPLSQPPVETDPTASEPAEAVPDAPAFPTPADAAASESPTSPAANRPPRQEHTR